ncbi:unnamed protein product [Effrenium voratum]|uniref:Uncharacterized protein n=1 Tax=Effrenium voratum TaxID=2562239 RepID=A0AA36ID17_9DINO|nr:unnamed protein product [Effrenium voratum]
MAQRVLLPLLALALCSGFAFLCGTAPTSARQLRSARGAVTEVELSSSLSTALEVSTPGWWANIVTLVVPLAILITLYLQSERRKAQAK